MTQIPDAAVAPVPSGEGVAVRLRRRCGTALAAAGLVLGLVAAALALLPVSHRAVATLALGGEEPLVGSRSPGQAFRAGDPADLESQVLALRAPGLLGRVAADPAGAAPLLAECRDRRAHWTGALAAALRGGPGCAALLADPRERAERLEGMLAVGAAGRSRVIEVAVTARDPDRAAALANAVADRYLAEDLARKVDTREVAIGWLRAEIGRAGEGLREAEIAIERQRRAAGLVRGQQASIASERLSAVAQRLGAAEADLAHAASRLPPIGRPATEAREVLDSRVVEELRQLLARASARHAPLLARFGEGHPSLEAMERQMRDLEARIDEEAARIVASLRGDHAAAQARVADLARQAEALKAEVGALSGSEAANAALAGDLEVRRALFLDLARQANALETERRLLAGDARPVSRAVPPTRPWFPKPLPFLAVGAVLAAAAGIAAALLRDRADPALRSAEAFARARGVPLLAHVPEVRPRRPADAAALQESMRALLGRCLLLPGGMPAVVLVASAQPGEGKTFVTLALARFAAATGRRVLAVECDLRRPTFRAALRLPPGPGLAEALRGAAAFPAAVRTDPAGGPDVVTAGRPALDSMELLSGPRLAALLAWARDDGYDLVLLDSPPSQALTDARLLARRAGGVLWCARWGRSREDATAAGMAAAEAAGGRILGLVATRARGGGHRLYEPRAVRADAYLPVASGRA